MANQILKDIRYYVSRGKEYFEAAERSARSAGDKSGADKLNKVVEAAEEAQEEFSKDP